MASIREQLSALLDRHEMAAEYPNEESALRRPEPRRLPVVQAAQSCAVGQLLPARDGSIACVVAKLASGHVVVLPDACPHDGGLLSDGFLDGDSIVCARHGWEFNVHSGKCLGRDDVRIAPLIHNPTLRA